MSSSLYRLPWRIGTSPTLSVALTDGCGFDCCGGRCEPRGLDVIRSELAAAHQWSRTDAIAISGGEPSRHPELSSIIKFAAQSQRKVLLCTNGYDLSAEKLTELRDQGLWGVNLRVNRDQQRPGWRDRTEAQIEGLRTHLAELVSRVGGLLCGFELEVPEGQFRQLADVLAWAETNVDRVQRIVIRLTENETRDTPGVRPSDMAENWAAAAWMASAEPTVAAACVTWRVGRRGGDILSASSRLLKVLCESYETLNRRHFTYLNPQSLRTQLSCWLGALTDMSLRPLVKEILSSVRHPTKLMSPRLSSQFLFTLEPERRPTHAAPCAGAGWDSLAAPVHSVVLGAIPG